MFDKSKTSRSLRTFAAMLALTISWVAFSSVSASAQDGVQAHLTNTDISAMSKSGVPDAVIFAKIKASTTNFDTSNNGLRELKMSGVSDAVVLAMMPPLEITSSSTKIPANSKIYIHPMDGFETYVVAALQKKKLPLVIVANREQADFEMKGSVEKQKAGWAKTIFISPLPSIDATMQVINVKTGVVVYSNSSTKANARRGRKGSAEHLAKNLVTKMQGDGDMKKN
jgi:hypothetical protein